MRFDVVLFEYRALDLENVIEVAYRRVPRLDFCGRVIKTADKPNNTLHLSAGEIHDTTSPTNNRPRRVAEEASMREFGRKLLSFRYIVPVLAVTQKRDLAVVRYARQLVLAVRHRFSIEATQFRMKAPVTDCEKGGFSVRPKGFELRRVARYMAQSEAGLGSPKIRLFG